MIDNLPFQALSDLVTRPVFENSGWLEASFRNNNKKNVTADLFCNECKKEKTFIGKAFNKIDLISNYQTHLHNMTAQFFGHGMPQVGSYGNVESPSVDEMMSEIVLPVDDVIIVQMCCPTCNGKAYICYHAEVEGHFDEKVFDAKIDQICVTKIGEYPNQEINRLQAISKYIIDFPDEYDYLTKAERAFYANLGVGAVIYLRKAYEVLLCKILDEYNLERPKPFRLMLQKADEIAEIIPIALKERAYGLFGEMSDIVHSDTDDVMGLDKYESLRDVFRMILDNILEKRRQAELAEKIKLDDESKRGGATK